jgi:hypothetical protein
MALMALVIPRDQSLESPPGTDPADSSAGESSGNDRSSAPGNEGLADMSSVAGRLGSGAGLTSP